MNATAVICVDCGAGNPGANAYCGECGNRIVKRGDGAPLHPGFKGPRRLLIASGLVLAVSVAIGAASFFLIQASGAAFGGPIVNGLLEAAGVTSVGGSGSSSNALSFLPVGTFLLASLFATVSAISGMAAGIWWLARWRRGDGPARVGTAIATAGDAGRKGLENAHRLGADSLEKARPKIAETTERSRAAAQHARDNAAERYEEAKPVVRRVAREGRATFDTEVAPRVSTGVRKGTAMCREWIRSRRTGAAAKPPLEVQEGPQAAAHGYLPPPDEGPASAGHRGPDGKAKQGSKRELQEQSD